MKKNAIEKKSCFGIMTVNLESYYQNKLIRFYQKKI